MKNFNLILIFFLAFTSSSIAQKTEVGYFITNDEEKVIMYKNQSKKKVLSRLNKGCDCMLSKKNVVFYVDESGKVKKYGQGKMKKLYLEHGNTYCRDYESGMPMSQDLGIRIPQSMELLSLPVKNKTRALQSILYQTDDYMLTMFTRYDLTHYIYIFDKKANTKVAGRYKYEEVGYGKDGKKALAAIKKYFKECKGMLKVIDGTIKNNKKGKKRYMIPVLQNITGLKCE